MALIDLSNGESHTEIHGPVDGPSILIITKLADKGSLEFDGGHSINLIREGQVFFIGAGTEITLNGNLVAYRAFVEVPQGAEGASEHAEISLVRLPHRGLI